MGKSFQVFLALMVFIVLSVIGLVVWVGPALIELAYFDQRRSEPMVVLELARGPAESFQEYDKVLDELLAAEEAARFGRFKQVHAVYGPAGKTYDRMTAIKMLAGRDIVQVMTASAYRESAAGLAARPSTTLLKLAGFAQSSAQWRDGLIVWLVTEREGVRRPLLDIMAAVADSAGRIVWDSQVQSLVTEAGWNRALVIDFATSQAALAWLREDRIVDAAAIANSRSGELALMVMQREPSR